MNNNIETNKKNLLADLFEDKFDCLSHVMIVDSIDDVEALESQTDKNNWILRNRFPLMCFEQNELATSLDFLIYMNKNLNEVYLKFQCFGNGLFGNKNNPFKIPIVTLTADKDKSFLEQLLEWADTSLVLELKKYFKHTEFEFENYNEEGSKTEISLFSNSEASGLLEKEVDISQNKKIVIKLRKEYLNNNYEEYVDFNLENTLIYIPVRISFTKNFVNIIYEDAIWSIPKETFYEEYNNKDVVREYNITYATWDLCEVD